ncbi:DUF2637 domain-containing protein [Mangrovihabitans endophyticus]|uniref:DUF2637 domain-containing protein n=1 Tax=Mangrovihabitans endophyticus TaxID=1751298 RepID=A0A8J3C477_9ACTN|nr:DUF2637 domain-containing protein [Mangrovihabitans endophyticus]GGL16313.1 hypothetical protein GCM10012284_58640 [Mangrovihabitans endophyticus]
MTKNISQLKRIGWGVRGVFALGIAASLAGNVLHAADNPISKAISAWSPLALMLAVELISRIPARRGPMSVARLGATAVIAGIAAWVSYWHMAGVAARYGETGASPYLLPFSVDGLIVVASISLVEIGGRLRAFNEPAADTAPAAVTTTLAEPVSVAPVVEPEPAAAAPVTKAPAKRVTPRPASAEKVARAAAKLPGAGVAEIAKKAGVSVSTARRHLRPRVTDASPSAPVPAETSALAAAA